jgi:formiminoglutamate deiminase
MTQWHAAYALLPDGLTRDVTFEAVDGRFRSVIAGQAPPPSAITLPGVVLPGFANAHSHAFHRALRGRTHADRGSFWTWRQHMYQVAGRLDPDRYLALARATYAEMALAGVTAVGEFHYLHHGPTGDRYDDPNAMGQALVHAAADAGVRLTLLDTCYLAGGLTASGHKPLDEVQRRFSDGDVAGWAERFGLLRATFGSDGFPGEGCAGRGIPEVRIGAAIHSVRAVPRHALAAVAEVASGLPLHIHLSEQPAENDACLAFYGVTPTELLHDTGVLGPATTAVHATHLTEREVALLGHSGTCTCFCPTTERDLADGIGPARALVDAGSPLCLGSDQHAVIDLLEEARALEMDERLGSGERGRFTVAELTEILTVGGQRSIGWPDAGRLQVGDRADLVAIRLDTVRTAGTSPELVILAASSADVDTVVVDGRTIVEGGHHVLGDIGELLRAAVGPLWAPQ